MQKEIWAEIQEWKNYKFSSHGRVYSKKFSKIMNTRLDNFKYESIRLSKGGRSTTKRVHVLIARAFLGERPKNLDVCHCDGNKSNNHLENLRYDTRSNNIYDCIRHKKWQLGETHKRSQLTNSDVLNIRVLSAEGAGNRELARKYNVVHSTINNILSGKTWKHL